MIITIIKSVGNKQTSGILVCSLSATSKRKKKHVTLEGEPLF